MQHMDEPLMSSLLQCWPMSLCMGGPPTVGALHQGSQELGRETSWQKRSDVMSHQS